MRSFEGFSITAPKSTTQAVVNWIFYTPGFLFEGEQLPLGTYGIAWGQYWVSGIFCRTLQNKRLIRMVVMRWKLSFIVLTICFCGASCGTPLVSQRSDKIPQTKEWQDFNQAWDNYKSNSPYEVPRDGDWNKYYKRIENCLEKTNNLKPLIKQGLISQAELSAMQWYFKHIREIFGRQTFVNRNDKEVVNKQVAHGQYRAYNVLNQNREWLKEIAGQKDCLDWVKNEWAPFLRGFYLPALEGTTPETLKYWEKTFWGTTPSMKEVTSLTDETRKTIETIEKAK